MERQQVIGNLILAITDPQSIVEDGRDAFDESEDDASPSIKTGSRAGLRDGELRVTCIFTDDANNVVHDWAKLTGRTFREVCMSMTEHYINTVIRPATSKRKLWRSGEPPKTYADLYDSGSHEDEWSAWFDGARD